MSLWAITPIKSFKRPKSRLGDVLTLEDRRVLVKFMLGRILLSQRKSKLFTNYLIVTEDSNVIDYVKKLGFKAFLQKKPGLNKIFLPNFGLNYLYLINADKRKIDGRFVSRSEKVYSIFNAAEGFWIPSEICKKYVPYGW